MKPLPILWQRLVTPEGETCERCHGTREAIEQAMPKLREALRPLGMEPVLEIRQMDVEAFNLFSSVEYSQAGPSRDLMGVCGE